MTDRTDIMQRILNLRELSTSSTSEAEALSAMKIADKLMHSYRIEEAELAMAEGLGEIKVDIVNETKFDLGLNVGRNRHKVQNIIWSLENYCEVEVVLKTKREFNPEGRTYRSRWTPVNGINAIGDKPDVQLFWWMLEHLRDSMDRSYDAWKRKQQAVGRGAKAAFQLSFGDTVCNRLRMMQAERRDERREAEEAAAKLLNKPVEDIRVAVNNGDLQQLRSSMSLVVASAAEQKRKAVQSAYREAYKNTRLGTASGFSYGSGSSTASAAGRSAGNSVGLGRPVGGGNAGLLN